MLLQMADMVLKHRSG